MAVSLATLPRPVSANPSCPPHGRCSRHFRKERGRGRGRKRRDGPHFFCLVHCCCRCALAVLDARLLLLFFIISFYSVAQLFRGLCFPLVSGLPDKLWSQIRCHPFPPPINAFFAGLRFIALHDIERIPLTLSRLQRRK